MAELIGSDAPITDKYCNKCDQRRPIAEFWKDGNQREGYYAYCKACAKIIKLKSFESGLIPKKRKRKPSGGLKFEDQNDTTKTIVFSLVEKPDISYNELAEKTGCKPDYIKSLMNQNQFLRALRGFGTEKVTRMIPRALHALEGSMLAKSEDVVLKAAVKVLENDHILGPERVDVTVTDLSSKKYDELVAILETTPKVSAPTLEAEVIA